MELVVEVGDTELPATLNMPDTRLRGGVVVLHGAEAGHRSFFLYEHLARLLPTAGVAVLRYDRRPAQDGGDVPLDRQAGDARGAADMLRRRYVGDLPVGLWGFSQGAWAAPLGAVTHPDEVAFLILVSACGVSPAAQMRFGTAEQLRRRGFGHSDLAELAELRATIEAYLRGDRDRASAQALVDTFADRPWFPYAYVPRLLPKQPGAWADMDFDPVPVFTRLACPVLVFFGETDEWMPVEDSVAVWQRAGAGGTGTVTVVRLPGCQHLPTLDEGRSLATISPRYADTLLGWLGELLAPVGA